MKKITLTFFAISALVFSACSPETTDETILAEDAQFRVFEAVNNDPVLISNTRFLEEYCHTTSLIAGQHHTAGEVTVERDGDDLIITYRTNGDWTISATHLSIGNCEDETIPTTGSGNPKVGHFEHSSDHSTGVNEVVYVLNVSVLEDRYCFAAHAVVSGPTGEETAWAEGPQFEGRSWAMFVEANLSDCPDSGNDNTNESEF